MVIPPLLYTVTAGFTSSRFSVVTKITVVRVMGHDHGISFDILVDVYYEASGDAQGCKG